MQRRAPGHAGARMRCFAAVPLEETALSDAQRLLASLRERVDGVRWVRPDALHVTVHFFGSIDDERVRAGLKALLPVAADMLEFRATLDRLGTFPSRGSPRVLWLGAFKEPPMLTALAMATRHALSRSGFDVERRPFRAHCTLGRPREPWTRDARDAASERVEVAPFTARRLVLYESTPAPGGNVYSERASFPFSAAALAAPATRK